MLTFRTYREGDDAGLIRLFDDVFGQSRTMEDFLWKFKQVPDGFQDDNIFLVEDEEKHLICGAYGGTLFRTKIEDQTRITAHLFDNCVRPEYRKGNVFVRLVRGLMAENEKRQEIVFAYGIAESKGLLFMVGKKLLQYRVVSDLPRLLKRLSLAGVASRFTQNPALILGGRSVGNTLSSLGNSLRGTRRSAVPVRQVDAFGPWADALWQRVSSQFQIATVRDHAYLTWRYSRPGHKYTVFVAENDRGEVGGYLTLGRGQEGFLKIGYILDILTERDSRMVQSLLQAATQEALKEHLDFLECWNLEGEALFRELREAGFRRRPWRRPLAIVYRTVHADLPERFFQDPRNWHITMSDSDVY